MSIDRFVNLKTHNRVLYNPGMGFKTFQRFNGDTLIPGLKWTEGYPVAEEFLKPREPIATEHPHTTVMYWRVAWRFIETAPGVYDWPMVDKVLQEAHDHGQTVQLRIACYADGYDVPDWVRAELQHGPGNMPGNSMVDHNEPAYYLGLSGFIKALAERYNGHPDLECVDVSIAGKWGEDGGIEYLEEEPMQILLDAYIDGFTKTALCMQPTSAACTAYARARCPRMGWRADCLGDMGGFHNGYCHMFNCYPFTIAEHRLTDWWETGPVSLEACWTMQHWFNEGWDIDYIISESLKWHITNFNNKSGRVPPEWASEVDYWQRRMGYRITPRRVTFGHEIKMHEPLLVRS
ncbi:MAG: beta-galactosidase, partial [Clostridia bacterium]|nr:beta-galactosidase [Clostridia bacterium]